MSDEEGEQSHLLGGDVEGGNAGAQVPALPVNGGNLAAAAPPLSGSQSGRPALTTGREKFHRALRKIKEKRRRHRRKDLAKYSVSHMDTYRFEVQEYLRQLSPFWQNQAPVIAYFINFLLLDLCIALAGVPEAGDKAPPYNPITMMVLSEVIKLVLSAVLWHFATRQWRAKVVRRRGLWFAVPAALYTVWYALSLVTATRVPVEQHALYSQAGYLFYVLAWAYLFRERVPNPDKPGSLIRQWRLTAWQWVAVAILIVAVCLARTGEGASLEVQDTARYPWWGVPLLLAQTLLLALSGAFTEYLYKIVIFIDMDLNQMNMYLYSFTAAFAAAAAVAAAALGWTPPGAGSLLRGFGSPIVVLVLLLSASLGLLMALVLKRQNNLVRLYAEAVHLPGQILLAQSVGGADWLASRDDWIRFMFACTLILASLLTMLYNGGFHVQHIVVNKALLRKKSSKWADVSSPDELLSFKTSQDAEYTDHVRLAQAKRRAAKSAR